MAGSCRRRRHALARGRTLLRGSRHGAEWIVCVCVCARARQVLAEKYSAQNVAFGMGGGLLQKVRGLDEASFRRWRRCQLNRPPCATSRM